MTHHRNSTIGRRSTWRSWIFLPCLLGLLAGQVYASDRASTTTSSADDLVMSAPANKVDITIYGSRFAQVEESRAVELKAGRNKIQLNGIAAQYRQDSLRLISVAGSGKFVYKSATYQGANLNRERLLKASVGKRIAVRDPSHNSTINNVASGILQGVNGNELILQMDHDNQIYIVNSSDVVVLPELPHGVSNTPALIIEAEVSQPGTYTLVFLYETNGLTYQVKHSLVYDDDHKLVKSLESSVYVVNQTGASFENATMRLISGRVAGGEGRYDAMGGARLKSMGPEALALESEDASVEDVGGEKLYTVPGLINLTEGQSRQLVLFVGCDIPVEREYFVPPFAYESAKQDVSIRLKLANDEKHNLGKPLPAGMLKVYQPNSTGNLQLTGTIHLNQTASGEKLELVIGEMSDIKFERHLVSQKDAASSRAPRKVRVVPQPKEDEEPAFEDQTWELTVYNYKKDKNVVVKVELALPAKAEIRSSSQPLVRKSATQAEAVLSVPAEGKASLKYTIRVPTR